MISSVFALKEANTIPEYLVTSKETMLEENYYMNSTLDFLLETHNELLSYRKEFYRTIIESAEENPYIIHEAFSDILSKIKMIIKKILAYIESMIKRFITQLNKFVRSDKHLSKMKSQIAKFPKDESFYITGYNFTLDDNVPVVDIVELDLSEMERIVGDDKVSPEVKLSNITQYIGKLSDERKMDDIRGQILNVDYGIPETNFNNEVFSVFRDGKSEESDITIDKEYVSNALKYFDGYSDKIKSLRRLQNNIKSKYKTLETKVEKIIGADLASDGSSKLANTIGNMDLKNSLDKLLNSEVTQIQRIANYHTQAIASKIDAYNALVMQDRNVLYKALSIVQKDINNTRTMSEATTSYDYTREASYRGYVLEKYFMDLEQRRFVEECLLLSESNIPELKTIHEALKMDKKNIFEKIKQIVKELFQKFMMKMNKFFTGNDEFLKKYKDVILTKKVEEYTLNNMPEYEAGISNIKAHKMKRIDLNSLISRSEDQIQKELLPAYNGDGEFSDFAKRYFLCNNKPNKSEVKSTELKMAEIYAFCLSAKDAVKTLEGEQKMFEQETDSIKNKVLQSMKKTETVDLIGRKYYYSTVLEGFVNEDEAKETGTGTANLKLDVPKADTNQSTSNDNLSDDVKTDDKGKDAETQKKEIQDNKEADSKKVKAAAKDYINTMSTINMAKITAFQKIYSEYMKILRHHVQLATGSMGNTGKFTEEDVKNLKEAMKEYQTAKDKSNAESKIISIYKSRGMVIDARDVQNLVANNAKALG